MSMYGKNHYNILISLQLIKINGKKRENNEKQQKNNQKIQKKDSFSLFSLGYTSSRLSRN